jgi:UDP-4-amino-4,6-dideoxy-N-acetyl-beta-L-altrosamine transaminase
MQTFLPYGRQWIDEEDIKAVVEVLRSDWITQGPKIAEFEEKFANYCGSKYAVAVSSGTAALHIACLAAGIKSGDEVITSPITFVASSNCILYCGAKPVFADIQPDTFNIDPEEIQSKITEKTKAIIPVHFAGHPVEMEEISQIAKQNNLLIIEDACHALGAQWKDSSGKWQKIGNCSHSDMAIFSFHPVKHITTGEGGMVTTNSEELYERLKLFRTHGITKDPKRLKENHGPWYYEMHQLGYNYRITDFQCALGIKQLEKLDDFIKRRRQIATLYNKDLGDMEEIITPQERKDVRSSYHLYVIQLNLERLKATRKDIFENLKKERIGVQVHYIPVHLQPYYQKTLNYKKGDLPKAEKYYERTITLPLFPKMTDSEVERVVEVLKTMI